MQKLEKSPFLLSLLVLMAAWIISKLTDNPSETIAGIALLLGAFAFANTLWLNHRINQRNEHDNLG